MPALTFSRSISMTGLQWAGVAMSLFSYPDTETTVAVSDLIVTSDPFRRSDRTITLTLTATQIQTAVLALRADEASDGLSMPQREALAALTA